MLQINQLSLHSADENHSTVSFENPLQLLLSCHDKILHFSSAVLTLSTTLQQQGWNEPLQTSAGQIRRYFNVSGPQHHLDEEEHLFPTIISLDPELKQSDTIEIMQLINRLIKEHVESDILWEALDEMLAEQSEDFATMIELSQQFAADSHEHVTLENELIIPYAKNHLNDSKLKQMGADIARRRGVKLPV